MPQYNALTAQRENHRFMEEKVEWDENTSPTFGSTGIFHQELSRELKRHRRFMNRFMRFKSLDPHAHVFSFMPSHSRSLAFAQRDPSRLRVF